MEIVYIHQYFTTPRLGGGTRSYEFARRLAAAGHRVTVITGTIADPEALADGLPAGVRVISTATAYRNAMSGRERIRSFLRFAAAAARVGWRLEPDVVFATSTPLTVGIPALLLSWRHRTPFVFEVRDLWPEAPIRLGAIRNPLLIRALRGFERLVYRRAAHVIALSPGMARGVRRAGARPDRVSMIPNAADLELFRPGPVDAAALERRGLPARPTVLYAGALGIANAADVLGGAAVELERRGADAQIVVAGEGRRLPELERLARRHGLRNLILLGAVPKPEVVELCRAAVAGLVLFSDAPILWTNSPNKFFDLLAAGRPVITNMRGWIARLVRRHRLGWVVPPGDPAALADAIAAAAAAHEAEIEAMGRNARSLAEREFDRAVLARRVEDLLRQAVQARRTAAGREGAAAAPRPERARSTGSAPC